MGCLDSLTVGGLTLLDSWPPMVQFWTVGGPWAQALRPVALATIDRPKGLEKNPVQEPELAVLEPEPLVLVLKMKPDRLGPSSGSVWKWSTGNPDPVLVPRFRFGSPVWTGTMAGSNYYQWSFACQTLPPSDHASRWIRWHRITKHFPSVEVANFIEYLQVATLLFAMDQFLF